MAILTPSHNLALDLEVLETYSDDVPNKTKNKSKSHDPRQYCLDH